MVTTKTTMEGITIMRTSTFRSRFMSTRMITNSMRCYRITRFLMKYWNSLRPHRIWLRYSKGGVSCYWESSSGMLKNLVSISKTLKNIATKLATPISILILTNWKLFLTPVTSAAHKTPYYTPTYAAMVIAPNAGKTISKPPSKLPTLSWSAWVVTALY